MSVISAEERHAKQPATADVKVLELRREWVVTIDAPAYDGAVQALAHSTIPVYGTPWPFAITGYVRPVVRKISSSLLDAEKSRVVYLVEVEYNNSRDYLGGGGSGTPNSEDPPWEDDPQYEYDYNSYQGPFEQEPNSPYEQVVNTVGDPFDPPPERTRYTRKITITRNTQAFSPADAKTLQNTVNEAAITINSESIDAECAHLLRWSARTSVWTNPTTGSETTYYEETIEIELDADGFELQLRNQGFRYRPAVGADPVVKTDASGQPVSVPVLLKEDGTIETDPDNAHYLSFQPYKITSWSNLSGI